MAGVKRWGSAKNKSSIGVRELGAEDPSAALPSQFRVNRTSGDQATEKIDRWQRPHGGTSRLSSELRASNFGRRIALEYPLC